MRNKDEIQKLTSQIETLNDNIKYNLGISEEYRVETDDKIEKLNTEKKHLKDELSQKDEDNQKLREKISRLKTSEGRKTTARQEADVVIVTQVKIRDEDDNVKPWISGAEFLAEGYLAICDGGNMKIKVFTGSFEEKKSLSLETQPWDVAELERNSLAVTLPYRKQLLYVQVQPTLQKKGTLELNKMCWGITVFGNELYVTHLNKLGEGGVIILDTEGQEIKSISAHSDFLNPENLAVNEDGSTYVSDNDSNLITVIDSKGSIIRKYHEPDLEKPGGICFDMRGNVIICGSGSNNLHIVSADGKRLKKIQTPKNPLCVAYRKDDVLVIGFDNDELLVMQLDKLLAEKNEHEW